MRTLALFGLVGLGMTGCGGSANVVSGTVNVNERPIERGYLTFFPLEGTKARRGVEVKGGHYHLKDLPPGQWRVLITETPEVEIVRTVEGPTLLKMQTPP